MSRSLLRTAGSTRAWRRLRVWVLNRDGFKCQFPGERTPPPGSWAATCEALWPTICGAYADHVDHVDRRQAGGGDNPARLRAACEDHNLGRGQRDDAQLLDDWQAGQLNPTKPTTPQRQRWAW